MTTPSVKPRLNPWDLPRTNLGKYISRRAAELQSRYLAQDATAKATLAQLRNGIRRPIGNDVLAWGAIFDGFPPELTGRRDEPNRAEVAAMAAMLSKCSVAAPFAGRVSEQKVREQQYVQPGQALLEIIDDSVLELEFIAPSRWLAWLRPGHAFQVRIDETGKSYPAKVLRIGAKVDPVSQSVKLASAINGKFPELIAGMSGTVLLVPPSGQGQ